LGIKRYYFNIFKNNYRKTNDCIIDIKKQCNVNIITQDNMAIFNGMNNDDNIIIEDSININGDINYCNKYTLYDKLSDDGLSLSITNSASSCDYKDYYEDDLRVLDEIDVLDELDKDNGRQNIFLTAGNTKVYSRQTGGEIIRQTKKLLRTNLPPKKLCGKNKSPKKLYPITNKYKYIDDGDFDRCEYKDDFSCDYKDYNEHGYYNDMSRDDVNERATTDVNERATTDVNERATTDVNERATTDVNERATTDVNERATDVNKVSSTKCKNKKLQKYKKYTFKEVEKIIDENYLDTTTHIYSSAFDIIACYLKGQKIIYIESMTYSENKLNKFMLPSIILSSVATVMGSIVDYNKHVYIIITITNAIIAVLLSIINYLKLDATAQAYRMSAHQYDKLQTSAEFTSGTILLFDKIVNPDEKSNVNNTKKLNIGDNNISPTMTNELELMNYMTHIGKKVNEIKESNNFIVPQEIRRLYPVIYNINVFSIIKKLNDHRKTIIGTIKNILNELKHLTYMRNTYNGSSVDEDFLEIEQKIICLHKQKQSEIEMILLLKSAYYEIDKVFQKEIENANIIKRSWFYRIFGVILFKKQYIDPQKINKFVERIFDPFSNYYRFRND
jgi:hypothetical protein